MSASALKVCGLLQDLSEEDRDALWEELECSELGAGRAVFEEGAEADGLVLILEGEVRLEARERGALGELGAGAALGALSLVAAGRREVTAIATSACKLAHLSRGGFRRIAADSPQLACRLQDAILRELAANLREALPLLRAAGG